MRYEFLWFEERYNANRSSSQDNVAELGENGHDRRIKKWWGERDGERESVWGREREREKRNKTQFVKIKNKRNWNSSKREYLLAQKCNTAHGGSIKILHEAFQSIDCQINAPLTEWMKTKRKHAITRPKWANANPEKIETFRIIKIVLAWYLSMEWDRKKVHF